MQTSTNDQNQALIFIPDISGFTQFVNETEINHAKHIIEELLEVLIDSNEIGLQLSEVEGDALLFYRKGNAPTAAELLAQIQKMYVNFHGHLKKYELHRICSCGACCHANSLRLKFIAHFGEIAEKQVKDRQKLFGRDVITAHRLLKNKLDSDEYSLFSNNLVRACSTWMRLDEVAWAEVTSTEEELDTGKVHYCFIELEPLSSHVPEPRVEDFTVSGATQKILESEQLVEAPLDLAFDLVSDLSIRHHFMVGLKGSDKLSDSLTRNGSSHRCVIKGTEKDPFLVSHDFSFEPNKVTFVETELRKGFVTIWTLSSVGKELTRVTLSTFVKPNPILGLIFNLFMKKGLQKNNDQTLINFNDLCKKLMKEGQVHERRIVLPDHVMVAAS